MASAFNFVPRNVAKHAKLHNNATTLATASPELPLPSGTEDTESTDNGATSASVKPHLMNLAEEDVLIYFSLAFSHYSVSTEQDLFKTFLWNQRENDRWIPITHILGRSLFLRTHVMDATLDLTENLVVKALRNIGRSSDHNHALRHLASMFELRLSLTNPTSSRATLNSTNNPVGARGSYEVRSGGIHDAVSDPLVWEPHIVYLENIPLPHRSSIPAIYRFVASLLALDPSESNGGDKDNGIENIYLPSHHNDRPDDIQNRVRKCKGFCFVVFSCSKTAARFNSLWPWSSSRASSPPSASAKSNEDVEQEAVRFGFRTLPMREYQKLQSMYEARRQQIVGEMAAAEDSARITISHPNVKRRTRLTPNGNQHPQRLPDTVNFPPGCLLFIRNIHQDTNKTTLRKLISSSLDDPSGIDYVDYTKGLDNCHIRLCHPKYALQILKFFDNAALSSSTDDDDNAQQRPRPRRITQSSGLDETGKLSSSPNPLTGSIRHEREGADADGLYIEAELILGRREQVYWDRVPEKVKKGAVAKYLALCKKEEVEDEDMGVDREVVVRDDESSSNLELKRKKGKRRKHGQG